jgi:hypothetical protein
MRVLTLSFYELHLAHLDEQRLVGLVMIPGIHLVKVETEDLDLYT